MPSKKKNSGGRPPVYKGNQLRHIVSLIRKHGLTGAKRVLNDEADAPAERNTNLVPEPLGISMPTLGKFAKEAGIVLTKGRPKLKKAA